jgi:hypothetical protein
MQRVRHHFYAAFFVLILFSPTQAISASVSLEASLGFNGTFSLNKWTPIHVVLENRGRTLKGLLEVIVTSGSEFQGNVHDTTYDREVELPTRSKKMYAFTIHVDSVTHPLIIRLKQDDKTIVAKSLNLRNHHTEDKLVLFSGIENVPDASSMPERGVQPIISHDRFLPEIWYGYEGVEVIVMDAKVLDNLRERQFVALTDWVRKGGKLITSGRSNYGSFLNQRTRHLLPVKILGLKRIFEINALEKFCGQGMTNSDGFPILRVEMEGALRLVQEDDTSIILQKTHGIGHVIFLAFDFDSSPFSEWPGRKAFWKKILSLNLVDVDPGFKLEEKNILSALTSSIPARFPAFVFVLLFLIVYILFVQFLFNRIERKREQRPKHFIFLLVIIALFSFSSYRLFFSKNTDRDPTYNSFLHVKTSDQSMTAKAEYVGGLYSLKHGNHRLNFGTTFYPFVPIRPDWPRDVTLRTLAFHENEEEQSLSIPLEKWSHRFLKMSTWMDIQFRGQAFRDDQGLLIMVENMTSHTILDSRIYYDGRFFSLGDIASGKKPVKRLTNREINKKAMFLSEAASTIAEEMVGDHPSTPFENMRNSLLESLLLQVHSRYHGKQEIMYLFGWIDSNVIQNPLTGIGTDGDGVALIELEIGILGHK